MAPFFIIDCDTGRDDALALWVALLQKMPLAGIVASYGNVPLGQVVENTARVLSLGGNEDCPLLAGAKGPMRDHRGYRDITLKRQEISGNGLCDLDFPKGDRARPASMDAATLAATIAGLAETHGRLDYIILGPATNFANICNSLGDDIHHYINSVTMLGGRMDGLWTQTPLADFNVICDPFALRDILARGIKMRLVTLNTTWDIALPLDALEKLKPQNALAETAKELMIAHTKSFSPDPVFRFHDPAIMLAMNQHDRFEETAIAINCDEDSPDFGQVTRSENGFPALLHHADTALQESILQSLLDTLGLGRH